MRLIFTRPMHLAFAFLACTPSAFAQGGITSESLAPPSGVASRPLAPLARPSPSPTAPMAVPLAPLQPLPPVAPIPPIPPQAIIAPRMDPPMATAPSSGQGTTEGRPASRAPSLLGHSAPGQSTTDLPQASPSPYRPTPRAYHAPPPAMRSQRLAPIAPTAPFSSTTRSPLPGNLATETRRPATTARDLAPP